MDDRDNAKKSKTALLNLVPQDGKSIGNVTLVEKFKKNTKLSEDDYWTLRNELINEGKLAKGKGKGGSVYRLIISIDKGKDDSKKQRVKEKDLYEPFIQTLERYWVKDYNLQNYVIEKTASQGSKDTGGKWTRPDITLIDVKTLAYIPNKILEVITFEIKPCEGYDVSAVFETASHSVFAHKSYLAIHYNGDSYEDDPQIDNIIKRCEIFGVGLIIFKDPKEWKTVAVVSESKHHNPDPNEVNQFITAQISSKNRDALIVKMK